MIATIAMWVGLVTGLVTLLIWLVRLFTASTTGARKRLIGAAFRSCRVDAAQPWRAFHQTVPTRRALRRIAQRASKLAGEFAPDIEMVGFQINQALRDGWVSTSAVVAFSSRIREESIVIHLPDMHVDTREIAKDEVFAHSPDNVTGWHEGWLAAIRVLGGRILKEDTAFLFAEFFPNTDRLAFLFLPVSGAKESRLMLQRGTLSEGGQSIWNAPA